MTRNVRNLMSKCGVVKMKNRTRRLISFASMGRVSIKQVYRLVIDLVRGLLQWVVFQSSSGIVL